MKLQKKYKFKLAQCKELQSPAVLKSSQALAFSLRLFSRTSFPSGSVVSTC